MRSATKVTVSTFGAIMGLAGIEHGIGEILQGNGISHQSFTVPPFVTINSTQAQHVAQTDLAYRGENWRFLLS